jgi:diguanylate cyclase (GGDEF)-like protein
MLNPFKKLKEKDIFRYFRLTLTEDFHVYRFLPVSSTVFKDLEGNFLDTISRGYKKEFESELKSLAKKGSHVDIDLGLTAAKGQTYLFRLLVVKTDDGYEITGIEMDSVLNLKSEAENLREWALLDPLTGLLNRRGFWTLVENLIHSAARDEKNLGLIFFDMDGLKAINTTQGHEAGDNAIKEMAGIMRAATRKTDVLARMGGDEFVIVFALDPKKDFTVEDMCERLQTKTRARRRLENTASIGGHLVKSGRVKEISQSGELQRDWERHMEIADEYSREAKRRGKNQYVTDLNYKSYKE